MDEKEMRIEELEAQVAAFKLSEVYRKALDESAAGSIVPRGEPGPDSITPLVESNMSSAATGIGEASPAKEELAITEMRSVSTVNAITPPTIEHD